MIHAFLFRVYKYHFVSECFDLDAIMDVMWHPSRTVCLPQSSNATLYVSKSRLLLFGI